MQTEWSEDGMYWLGTDGARRSGWKYLAPPDEDGYDFYGEESMDGMYWYYFGSNGKKYTPENTNEGGDYRIARVDGEYFCFGPDGRMMTGWVYFREIRIPRQATALRTGLTMRRRESAT